MTWRFKLGGPSVSRRYLARALVLALGSLAIGCGILFMLHPPRIGADAAAPSTGLHGARSGAVSLTRAAVTAVAMRVANYPVSVKQGKRYLVDAAGVPFFIHGESAWGLITQLRREEVDRYLDDRHARGFNTILVMLLNASFSTNSPANAYGQLPFLVPGDYTAPNEAYFAHADWVLRRAADKGFLVLLAPSYTGSGGGSEGWYHAMEANGPDRLRLYGEFLGRRYRDFANIVWVQAGDFNPPAKELVRAIAEGIQSVDPSALHTAHGSRNTAALEYWPNEPWLQINNVYTARPKDWPTDPVYLAALEQYERPEGLPFFLIEGVYENEHQATERQLRTQAYQAVLSGAAGHVFGNNPIWHFDGRGLYPAPVAWEEALGSRGTQSMTHLLNLMTSVSWWLLQPDTDNTLLTGGFGTGGECAVAGRAADRSFALVYLPSSREVTLDLAQLAGPEIVARWYDPADGAYSEVVGSPFPTNGSRQFTPERTNASGFDDWVLTLVSVPSASADRSSDARTQLVGRP